MDVLLVAAVIVLVVLTLWIVWRPSPASGSADSAVGPEEANPMLPQGDEFEDQYTSATADLSAGGVAVTTSATGPAATSAAGGAPPYAVAPGGYQTAAEAWSEPTLAYEGGGIVPPRAGAPGPVSSARTVSIGAAALLTLGGAVAGAWLYSRWQRQRSTPLKRLLRKIT